MKTNLKVALSVIALAALVAVPAVAKSRPPQQDAQQQRDAQTPIYSNKAVVVDGTDGKVIGADPDSLIRFQIQRDNRSYTRN